jgi:hypothetical protein
MDGGAELIRSAVTLDIIQRKLGVKSILSRHDAKPKAPPEPTAKRRKRPGVARHTRKCNVCQHPEREAIEHGFLCWRSPDALAKEYGIADHSSIYRHVHATGIFARRRANLRMALEPLLERAESVKVTAGAVISAARLYATINDDGQWIKPPTRRIVIVKHEPPLPSEPSSPGKRRRKEKSQTGPAGGSLCGSRLQPRHKVPEKTHVPLGGIFAEPGTGHRFAPLHSSLTTHHSPLRCSNRQNQGLEPHLTGRKQTTATRSNRQNFGVLKSKSCGGFLPRAVASGIVERRDE